MRASRQFAACAVLVAGLVLAPELGWAWKGMVLVCGATSGCVKGGSTVKGFEGWIVVEEVALEFSRPFVRESGTLAGRRTAGPVVITKSLDVASPQLVKLADSGEAATVELRLFVKTTTGSQWFFTVRLEGAQLVDLGAGGKTDTPILERAAFVFDTITLTDVATGMTYTTTYLGP